MKQRTAYEKLVARLGNIGDIRSIANVVQWDAETVMPKAAAAARGRHMAIIAALEHKTMTDPETLRLIEALEREAHEPDSDEAQLARLARIDYEDATKLPADFVESWSELVSVAQQAWGAARAQNDFAAFQPHLQKLVDLSHRKIDLLKPADEPYDAVLKTFEPGLNTARIRQIFAVLKHDLIPLLDHVAACQSGAGAIDDSFLRQEFSAEAQAAFCLRLTRGLGLDEDHARLDVTRHPATNNVASPFDVRISTRYQNRWLGASIFSVIHECGHAIYELNLPEAYANTPLGSSASMGIHESQSRLYENFVGRSREFWQFWYPELQRSFPDQLGSVSPETFYRAIHKSTPSFIRTEADELSYSLHIILRFEIEQDLMAGRLSVAQLPKAWNDRFEAIFGIRPRIDSEGVLQDVHWSAGLFGYFPSYALGNIFQAQLVEELLKQHPELPAQIASGTYDTLRNWLRTNIHQHGRRYDINELAQRITGKELQTGAYVRQLDKTYGAEIYPGFARKKKAAIPLL